MTKIICNHAKNESLFSKLFAAIKTGSKDSALIPNEDGVIYWHIVEPFTEDQEKYKTILAFEKAFKVWQPHFAPIRFESTSKKQLAPIKIHFMGNSNPKLPEKFTSGVLAYAYFPNKRSLGIHSDMYFNEHYQWSEMHGAGKINLFKVAVHELGHAFGLSHSTFQNDIMYPSYQPNDSVALTEDTKEGIEYLYGDIKKQFLPKEEYPKIPEKEESPEETTPNVSDVEEFIRAFFIRRFQLTSLTNEQVHLLCEGLGISPLGGRTQRFVRLCKALGI